MDAKKIKWIKMCVQSVHAMQLPTTYNQRSNVSTQNIMCMKKIIEEQQNEVHYYLQCVSLIFLFGTR